MDTRVPLEHPRYRWYMEALSSASIAKLMTMWATWERRANPIICNDPVRWLDIAALVPPPEQWEMDCFVAILELIGELEHNLSCLPLNHPFYKPPAE